MVDPFSEEKEQIAALLQRLADLAAAVEKTLVQTVKPVLDPSEYELVEVGKFAFAYISVAEPKHYLCTGCYAGGEKSVLQGEPPEYKTFPGKTRLTCPRCKFAIYMDA